MKATSQRGIVQQAERELSSVFERIDHTAAANLIRVLAAFRENRLTEEHFMARTGYGLDDEGRRVMDAIFAQVMQAEAACVRLQFVSGTHALACALFGNLLPDDRMLVLTGEPYDTLHKVIGKSSKGDDNLKPGSGSLLAMGIDYQQVDLDPARDSEDEMVKQIKARLPVRLFYIQKSRGYSSVRRTIGNQDIQKLAQIAKKLSPQSIVMVDNCYGEFVESNEPSAVGADLVAGSLIKNPGGGLAVSGGYIAGGKEFVEAALNRLTAPGIGGHQGISYGQNRLLMHGLFLAPTTVAGAVKGMHLVSWVLGELGVKVSPSAFEERFDIIQSLIFGNQDHLVNFCRALQRTSPVNAHVVPEPAHLPGYEDKVIMAGGTFIEGSTIELSADGPLRPPYTAFMQGGLTYLHVKCALEEALTLSQEGVLPFLPG